MKNCWFCYNTVNHGQYHPECAKRFFGNAIAPTLQFDDAILKELAQRTVNERIAITGVQPKLSVTMQKGRHENRLTIVGLWGEYILKPQHKGYAQMPETEDFTMHLASLFGIPVCAHTLVEASDGKMVYLAKRFDRNNGLKIHTEDFCQLSEFPTANKYKSSYERVGKLVAAHCTNSGFDILNYFELVLFSYLSGNNDMHLKNFSVIYTNTGIALSPAYDLLNVTLVNPEDTEELALTLNGKKANIKLQDFEAFANTLKIPAKAYNNCIGKFASKNHEVEHLINRSFLHQSSKEAYHSIWTKKQQIFK